MQKFIEMLSDMNSQRYSKVLSKLINEKIPCGFFCALDASQWKIDNIINLTRMGLDLQCICVLDDNYRTHVRAEGIPLVTFREFADLPSKPQWMLYIDTNLDSAFCDFFRPFGLKILQLEEPITADKRCDEIYEHLPEIVETYRMFDDEESRAVYRACLKARLSNRHDYYRYAVEPQYWLEPFTPVEGDIAIDGGAYDGVTSSDFASRGAKVYAFEMDQNNYQRSLARAEKYKFTLENMGLSSEERTASYFSGGAGSHILSQPQANGGLVARFIDIDTYVQRKNLPRVDYIKLDIEGAELDCLKGAAKSIVRWKPKMAISAYHRPEDLWTLAPYIKALRSDYEFAFRHYRVDYRDYVLNEAQRNALRSVGLSLFATMMCEMVLYCK